MELKDIIKSNKDRLFVLDNECFIIFTADNLNDEKPFIRIGNWIDLPPESIPMIENIIVTDSITGNAAHEQFNIDPKFLSTNRYIGSRMVVQNYINFQKNFGLNLNNVSIVDVEKDLPFLSKEQSISSKDSFLGIFYHNGNFRVIYKDDTLFDLKEYEDRLSGPVKELEQISNNSRDESRYSGSGIVIIDKCVLFYKNRYFTAYQFPKEYLKDFEYLNINPAKLRELVLPVVNLIDISDFLKWSNTRKNVVKLYSGSKDEFELMQKLFQDMVIKNESFHGHSFDTGDGVKVQNYPGSINEKITFINTAPSFKKVEVAYLKEYLGIREILDEKHDAIIVPYAIYEQASLFFKSTITPVICIDDGNANISKLKMIDVIVLNQRVQYEVNKFEDEDMLVQNAMRMLSDRNIIEYINSKDIEGIKQAFFNNIPIKDKIEFADIKNLLNIISLLRIFLNTTTDRKFSSEIQRIIQKSYSSFDRDEIIAKETKAVKVNLYFYDNAIYEFYEAVSLKDNKVADAISDMPIRIETDRIRFKELLELYKKSGKKAGKDITHLSDEISRRKEFYKKDTALKEATSAEEKQFKREVLKIRLKKISQILIIIIIAAVLALISVPGYKYYKEYRESTRAEREKQEILERAEKEKQERSKREEVEKKEADKVKNEKEELVQKYNIHVSDHDIYLYANKVARKNGYREIEYKDLKEKNPNWIFPGNVFYLIDGQKITVIWGDTLWEISDKKLMEIQLKLYKLIEKIEEAKTKNEKLEMLKKAEELAFSNKHFKKIEEIKKGLSSK
jgi:hypothetical protein